MSCTQWSIGASKIPFLDALVQSLYMTNCENVAEMSRYPILSWPHDCFLFKRVKLTCTNSSTNVLSIKYCVWSRFKKIRLGLSCVNSHHVLVHATMYSDKLKSYITFTMWFHIILSLCLACLKETLWLFCSQGQEWPQTDVSHATFPTNIRDIDERTYVKFTLFTSVCCLIANVKHIGKLTDSFQRFSPASPPWRWPASAEPQFAH